jgi:hypothetical protein
MDLYLVYEHFKLVESSKSVKLFTNQIIRRFIN